MSSLIGIDGCPGGWLQVSWAAPALPVTEVSKTLPKRPIGSTIAIDMPIGLSVSEPRQCDLQGRDLLGARRSCIFPAPVRGALQHLNDYPSASAASFNACGKKMSKQTFFLMPKIAELDQIADESFHEAHPELSFMDWGGGTPFLPKKTAEGKLQRAALIDSKWPGAREKAEQDLGKKTGRWQTDDLLDAFAMLWTAERIAAGTAKILGSEIDPTGKPMTISI